MGQDPEAIRRQIEETRDEMSGTVDALGHKADVKTRTKDAITDRKDSLVGKISGSTPDAGEVKEGAKQNAKQAVGIAQENPLGLAVGSLAVGFLVGMLVPSTNVENEKLGPIADDVKERVKETGQEAVERGKTVAQEAAQSAKDTVQESGQQQAQELKGSAQEQAQEAGQSV